MKEKINDLVIKRYWIYATHSANKFGRLANMFSLTCSMLFSFNYILRNKPNIIIVQYPPVALPLLSLFFARLTKAHFIINASDIWPSAIADLGVIRKGMAYTILDKIETYLYKNASLCMAQSGEIIQHICSKSSTKTLLYRTGVNCKLFEKKNFYHINNGKLKIIYAGVMGIAHGLYALCQNVNFEKIGAELHIFGEGFEKAKISLYLEQNPKKSIFLHDVVNIKDIPSLLKTFDAALISQKTRVYGTIPSKMYEALATGLPVLYNGTGEGSSIIKDNSAGLISNPNNISELINNIKKLIKMSSEERALLGGRGRNTAEKFFDRKEFIEKLANLLKKEFS